MRLERGRITFPDICIQIAWRAHLLHPQWTAQQIHDDLKRRFRWERYPSANYLSSVIAGRYRQEFIRQLDKNGNRRK